MSDGNGQAETTAISDLRIDKATAERLLDLMRADGWYNVLSSIGRAGLDKTESTTYQADPVLDDQLLTALYVGDGLAKKIINLPAEDMVREWLEIENDPDHRIIDELDRLRADRHILQAIKWARLYGGSILLMGVQDGRELSEPRAESVRGIDWLKVYPESRVNISTADVVKDPRSPFFDEVELFPVQPYGGGVTRVHRTRALVFNGERVPRDALSITTQEIYWGVSELQGVWNRLRNFGAIEKGIGNTMMELIVTVYKLMGLDTKLSMPNGDDQVLSRLAVINAAKSMINAVVVDSNEDFSRGTATMGGVAEVIDRFMMVISGIVGIPVTRLWGRSPAGMNATGEGDLTNYYDTIKARQRSWLRPAIQPLVDIIASYVGVEGPNTIKFNSPWQMTDKETVDMRLVQAKIDKLYIENGVLRPEEVADSRFRDGYSLDTVLIDQDEGSIDFEEPEPEPEDQPE